MAQAVSCNGPAAIGSTVYGLTHGATWAPRGLPPKGGGHSADGAAESATRLALLSRAEPLEWDRNIGSGAGKDPTGAGGPPPTLSGHVDIGSSLS